MARDASPQAWQSGGTSADISEQLSTDDAGMAPAPSSVWLVSVDGDGYGAVTELSRAGQPLNWTEYS
jgi:hypothetical protein